MNRRTKIIVSVSGICIVALALIGLTYAYFLTTIKGNTNEKSISITTSTEGLALAYDDGYGAVDVSGLMPGGDIPSKTFSVTNNGKTEMEYVVTLENVKNEFERQEDITYVLECASSNGGSCNGVEAYFPNSTDKSIIAGNTISVGEEQTYTLTITYSDINLDQSVDMGKTLSAKVNIDSLASVNKYDEGTLAYEIINNALTNKNNDRTKFSATPLTFPAREVSGSNEKTLSVAADDYGDSYYFRGSVEDNYLELNNMCFRIVRIEGDGSIKITLAKEDLCSTITESDRYSALLTDTSTQETKCVKYGYKTLDGIDYSDYENYEGGLYTELNNWYDLKLKSLENKLKDAIWCLGENNNKYDYNTRDLLDDANVKARLIAGETVEYYYETGKRIAIDKKATYKCSKDSERTINHIGALTPDEVAYAGAIYGNANHTFYIAANSETDYWVLSHYHFYKENSTFFNGDSPGIVYVNNIDWGYASGTSAVRPTIVLKSDVQFKSGNGTKNTPYTIK